MQGYISCVRANSLAAAAGIVAGEKLCSVNGRLVKDIIELSYCLADDFVTLEIEGNDGLRRNVHIEKDPDEALGLEFGSAVFDHISLCKNKCIFCFVDQMIPGMRKGLYVRDDDFRLSFLYGNFITLTNMGNEDFDRLIASHMSPLYVSVHATDPGVRCRMMRHPHAGQLMQKLNLLFEAGIQVHTQIVCCPGYNDGEVLARTFADLYACYPNVITMAVVPVGLTKHREHLPLLRTFTKQEATLLVEQVTRWQQKCRHETGKSFIYLGDEFYLLADKKIPDSKWYDGFPQLENGIGLTRTFIDEWDNSLKCMKNFAAAEPALIPVGESAYKILNPMMNFLNSEYKSEHAFVPVPNNFFGGKVNVTGLLTGGDILTNVTGARIILPEVVLNRDLLFLDDMSLKEFRLRYEGKVDIAKGARELLQLLLQA